MNAQGISRMGTVTCPGCRSTVNIYGVRVEKLDDGRPLKCPDCRKNLNDVACEQLGWKR